MSAQLLAALLRHRPAHILDEYFVGVFSYRLRLSGRLGSADDLGVRGRGDDWRGYGGGLGRRWRSEHGVGALELARHGVEDYRRDKEHGAQKADEHDGASAAFSDLLGYLALALKIFAVLDAARPRAGKNYRLDERILFLVKLDDLRLAGLILRGGVDPDVLALGFAGLRLGLGLEHFLGSIGDGLRQLRGLLIYFSSLHYVNHHALNIAQVVVAFSKHRLGGRGAGGKEIFVAAVKHGLHFIHALVSVAGLEADGFLDYLAQTAAGRARGIDSGAAHTAKLRVAALILERKLSPGGGEIHHHADGIYVGRGRTAAVPVKLRSQILKLLALPVRARCGADGKLPVLAHAYVGGVYSAAVSAAPGVLLYRGAQL